MPKLRKDPVVGRWVIIATERARRPGNIVDTTQRAVMEAVSCPYCGNHLSAIDSIKDETRSDQNERWLVKVLASPNPLFQTGSATSLPSDELYEVISPIGVNEIVIESPEHVANMADLDVAQIQRVIEVWQRRFKALQSNNAFQYIQAYKNYGVAAGSRNIGHARSHVLGLPVIPLRVQEKLHGAQRYFEEQKRCLYCELIQKEEETPVRIIEQNEHFTAFVPFAARYLFEVWVIPRQHHCRFADGITGQEEALARILKCLLRRFQMGLNDPAYNLLIESAPLFLNPSDLSALCEKAYHWHLELLPRLTRLAGFEKGTDFFICPAPPEQTAEFLRRASI